MSDVKNFISPKASIGHGTKVWHFTVILDDVTIGEDCNIGSCCEIGRGSKVGNGTRIGFGSFFPSNSVIGKDVFIGPGVFCSDDKYPKVNNHDYKAEPPIIEDGASVGMSCVLLPGVRIGAGALVGAGSVVTRDVAPGTVLRGEPARITTHMHSSDR